MKNYNRFPSSMPHRASSHGVDGIFAWTIFIFLLMGFALFCWIGSFYVFGHPEKAGNYHLLMRLHKLEQPQRFELTEAPRGEFLKPKQLLERFGRLSEREMRKVNDGLLANFLRNYHQTHALTPYVTEEYSILATFPLTKKSFFYPGVCALLQSEDQPEILLEQVFPAANSKLIAKLNTAGQVKKLVEAQNHELQEVLGNTNAGATLEFNPNNDVEKNANEIASLKQYLTPGQEIKFEKPLDLSAILHVEKLSDGRLKFTTISLLYGSYGPTNSGPILFSLAPPTDPNIEAGLPILSPKNLASAEEEYAAYRAKMEFSNQESSQQTAQPSSAFVLQIISAKPTAPVKRTLLKNTPRVEKGNPAPAKASAAVAPKVERALPLNTPAVLPATPAAAPVTPQTLPATPVAAALPTAMPATTTAKAVPATPPATPVATALPSAPASSTAEATPDLAAANQSVLPTPATLAATAPTSATELWQIYDPGKMPRGRFVAAPQLSNLAEQGLAGQRLYLQGDFAVTASGQDRSVLRYQSGTSSDLTPDRISKMRIIVAYPKGTSPPAEGTTVTRNTDRPFMITDVKKGNDGTVNVYVREIVK